MTSGNSEILIFEDHTLTDQGITDLKPISPRLRDIRTQTRELIVSNLYLSSLPEHIKKDLTELISYCRSLAQSIHCTTEAQINHGDNVTVSLLSSAPFVINFPDILQFQLAATKAHGIAIYPADNNSGETVISFIFQLSEGAESF